ncbi:MAG: alpha/beta fold hydrolase [Gaiella sp.]
MTQQPPVRVGEVHVEQAGAGDPVVFLHAGIADTRMWEPQWHTWASRFHLIGIDRRGYGRSDAPHGTHAHAADVVAVLDALGLDRVAVVGASFGGLVALDLAAAHPERVARLALAAPALPDQEWSGEMRAYHDEEERLWEAGELDGATELNVRFWLPGAAPAVQAAIREQQRLAFAKEGDAESVFLTEDIPAALDTISAPTLVVVGARDKADFWAIAERVASAIPGARLAVVDEASHLPSLERPEAFEQEVLPFLLAQNGLAGGGGRM